MSFAIVSHGLYCSAVELGLPNLVIIFAERNALRESRKGLLSESPPASRSDAHPTRILDANNAVCVLIQQNIPLRVREECNYMELR